jgi:hypothetical protein
MWNYAFAGLILLRDNGSLFLKISWASIWKVLCLAFIFCQLLSPIGHVISYPRDN